MGGPPPLTLRRSRRIRNAALTCEQAASSSDGQPRASTPPPARHDPTLRGLLSAGPALENLLDYCNEWDRRSLILSLPSFRDALRHEHVRPRFACQNYPDHASRKMQDFTNNFLFELTDYGLPPRGPCTTPARAPTGVNAPAHLRRAALVRHHNCQGHRLGYTSDPSHGRPHGEHLWICEICAHKAWERHSVLHKPRAIDLCLTCSQAHRGTQGTLDIDQCTCLWDQSEDKVHLCTECREVKSRRDAAAMLLWVQIHVMNPMHDPQATLIRHYIDEDQAAGESSCTCGMPVFPKIASHLLNAPTRLTFDELVRICVHCHKHRFLALKEKA